jgi:hypothetical protein
MNNWGNYTQSEQVAVAGGIVFISYWTPVAFIDNEGNTYATNVSFSRTTSKQITQWFGWHKKLLSEVNRINIQDFRTKIDLAGYNGSLGYLQ